MEKMMMLVGALALLALGAHMMNSTDKRIDEYSADKMQWNQYKSKFSKHYLGDEEAYRFGIFLQNLKRIAEHNASGSTYTLGITQFADMTQDEFHALYIGPKWDTKKLLEMGLPKLNQVNEAVNLQQGSAINWVSKGDVGPVNNQGQCGSCWSFSAAESIQSAYAVAGKGLPQLSEEQLVQCSMAYGNQGCNGGWPYQAFQYVMANPLNAASSYPYTSGNGITGTCNTALAAKGTYGISNYGTVPASCASLQQYLAQQPLSVCVDASTWSALYTGGIFPSSECGMQVDHAVLLVGTDGATYWTIQNSWATSWGENGYIQLQYGNSCAVCNYATYPIV